MSTRKDQTIRNQAVKTIPAIRSEVPSQMDHAGATDGNPPAVSLEPGEFVSRRTAGGAAIGRSKAQNLVNDSMRIGKGVLM
jgi:hypothetical protein